jgi:hypothetical protein
MATACSSLRFDLACSNSPGAVAELTSSRHPDLQLRDRLPPYLESMPASVLIPGDKANPVNSGSGFPS